MITDAFAALKAVLLADADVVALVGTHVYISEIPPAAFGGSPRQAILLRPAGGSGTAGEIELQDLTVDVFCYGADSFEADQLRRTVYPVLKYLRRAVQDRVLIHRCNPGGGPIMAHEPEGALPVVVQTWEVLASEKETPFIANSVNFDGTNDFLSRDGGLTGAADGKAFTLSVWLRVTDLSSVPRLLQNSSGATNFRIRVDVDGSVEVNAANPSAVGVLGIDTPAGTIVEGAWAHLYMAFNLADPLQRFIRKNGADVPLTVNAYDDDVIDFTAPDWFIGANQNDAPSLAADLAEYQFALSYIDNLARFYDGGRPVGPNPDGMIILLTGGTVNWHVNQGTGGGFTENGALTDGQRPVLVS